MQMHPVPTGWVSRIVRADFHAGAERADFLPIQLFSAEASTVYCVRQPSFECSNETGEAERAELDAITQTRVRQRTIRQRRFADAEPEAQVVRSGQRELRVPSAPIG
jgi:hypothetical protein